MPVRNIRAILSPTNTGKTFEALERMLSFRSGMIGFPLRLLARENYDKLVAKLGRGKVALITGEEKIVPETAQYFCCTVESMPVSEPMEFLCVDEIQLAADPERGHVFTDRIMKARGIKETLFLGSETIAPVLRMLIPQVDIEMRTRFSQLSYDGKLKLSRLPRRSAIVGFSMEDVYTNAEMIRRMCGGAAIVMGALSPRARNAQVELYQSGDVDFIVATDAIGMGLNMDIDHVAFSKTRKFDGRRHRRLRAEELAQIAGRAGRYQQDGSFSTLQEAGMLDPQTSNAIETHAFPVIESIYWRNSNLDYSSPTTLLASLNKRPNNPILMHKRDGIDHLALEQMLKKKGIADRAKGEDMVPLLWDICQIPDFRKTLNEAHFQLLNDMFLFLSDRGTLPNDWADRHIGRLENPQGDIDALMTRIAHTRTWTYISHRLDWFDNPRIWQQRTRQLEDDLSDALHQQLTYHFVDKRSSVLTRKLADNDALEATMEKNGSVLIEGQFIGKLKGFRFRADESVTDASANVLLRVARRALVQEVETRLKELFQDKGKGLFLDKDGSIFWRKEKIAFLVRGQTVYTPQVRVLKSDLVQPRESFEIQKLITDWVHEKIGRHFGPLFDLREAPINGYVKGFIFELFDCLGMRRTKDLRDALGHLSKEERAYLQEQGVYFGQLGTYLYGCTRQHQFELRQLLARIYLDMDTSAAIENGQKVIANKRHYPKAFYNLCGFYVLKDQAVRLDYLEKLATKIRKATKKKTYVLQDAQPEKGLTPDSWRYMMALMGFYPDPKDMNKFTRVKITKGKKKKAKAKMKTASRKPVDKNHPFAALEKWGS